MEAGPNILPTDSAPGAPTAPGGTTDPSQDTEQQQTEEDGQEVDMVGESLADAVSPRPLADRVTGTLRTVWLTRLHRPPRR